MPEHKAWFIYCPNWLANTMHGMSSVSMRFVSLSIFNSKTEVATVETEILRDYRFGQQQLIEIWGHACAIAITKVCLTSENELHYCEVA